VEWRKVESNFVAKKQGERYQQVTSDRENKKGGQNWGHINQGGTGDKENYEGGN